MEAIQKYVEIFRKSWKEKNRYHLATVMDELPDYLKNASKTDADQILDILLQGQDGMFQCLSKVLNSPSSDIDAFIKNCFKALQSIMDFSQHHFEPYILETRNLCFKCMKIKCSYYTVKIASNTLKKLIESYSNYDMELDEIVEYFMHSYARHYSKKDGSIYYIVLGAIGKHYPKLKSINQYINEIFMMLLKDYASQHVPNNTKPQPDEIKTYLDCYSDLFVNFVPDENESSKSKQNQNQNTYLKQLYSMIFMTCNIKTAPKLYRNKAIEFINYNARHFELLIFEDYQKWYGLIITILDDFETDTLLRNFYNIIAVHLMKEEREDVFWFFRNKFKVLLECEELSPRKLQSLVNGLGEFSVTFSKYAPAEGHKIFQVIAVRALHITNNIDDEFKTTANYLQTLSQIVRYSSNTTFHQISILVELSVRFIRGFPELWKRSHTKAIKALNATFANISYLEKHFQREFFNSVFYQGILWSCSHTLYDDLQLQTEFESIPKKQICYKNYLPFWHSIFKIEGEYKSVNLTLQMFDDFVSVLMMYITQLNLDVEPQDDDQLSLNAMLPLKAKNETDFWFFKNLIDLYQEIFEKVDGSLMQNSVEKLTIFLINYSYKHPLISGFYKLIRVILKNFDDILDYQQSLSKSCQELISQYISDILEDISEYSEELQFSCIFLVLNIPTFLIKSLIDEIMMLPIFEIAFNIGLSNLSLAFATLKTFENWIKCPDIQISNNFLKSILNYLEPYLSTNKQSSKVIQSNAELDLEKNQINGIYSIEITLEDLQNKILLFYGSLDSTILYDFVHEKSSNSNASWNKKNLLPYELLFPDIRLEIHLDKYLPRIVELTNSGDQIIKVSACELFHSVISIILGKNRMKQCFDKNVCIAVLRLGCDPNDSVKNLFHPLALQLTHYLSSRLMLKSKIPQYFIDSLFDGLSEEFNTVMRDHCGLYLKEFMQWSIRQSAGDDVTKNPNVLIIIRKINTFVLYPSNKKRLAAVSAFNNLYTIFRENLCIVQTYWLEFLYTFIKCLEEYDNLQVLSAIDHVEKVIKHYKNLFNAKNANRRKPPGFADETLGGCLIWLFAYCGSLNTKCRNKCMMLFENLLPFVDRPKTFKQELEKRATEIASKNLKTDFDCISVNNGRVFLTILDFHVWIMKKNFISSTCLIRLDDISDEANVFTNYFAKFVEIIVKRDVLDLSPTDANKLIEAERLADLTNEIILKIVEFISTVLDVGENHDSIIPWNNNLYSLIIRCIVSPQKIGLTAKSLQVSDKYYTHFEKLLTLMMSKTSILQDCLEVFMMEADENFSHFTQIRDIIEMTEDMDDHIYTIRLFVKGLQTVKKCKFLDFEEKKNFTISYWQSKTTEIFESLKVWMMDNYVCRKLNIHVKDYLSELMTLYFETYQAENVKGLINLIATRDPLETSTGDKIPHGEYFLDTFRVPILTSLLKNPSETMVVLDGFYSQCPHIIFCMLEELILFAERIKSTESEVLAEEILKRCGMLRRLLNDIEIRKTKFFNINHVAVKLMKNPTDVVNVNNQLFKDVHFWLSSEFLQSKDLEKKATLLHHFIICMADEMTESENTFPMLSANLRDMDDFDWLQTLAKSEVQRFHATTLFGVLLKSLVSMKSLLVYQAAIKFSAGVSKLLCKENLRKYLDPYFVSISDNFALKSLEICYQIFMDLNLEEQRFDVLRNFLLLSLESNKNSVVEEFYKKFCREMIGYIKQDIDTSSSCNVQDRKRLIINKIACYSIFELLFAKFDINFNTIKDETSGVEKTLSSFLVEEGIKLRSYSTIMVQEMEVTRLLHCATLNCCISIISQKKEEKFFKFVFMEVRPKNQLIWERIINCQKRYELPLQSSSSIRKDRKKLINIRSVLDNHRQVPSEFAVSYQHRRDLSQLSFADNIHAYDLNDVTVSLQPCKKLDGDHRLDLSFEIDALNEHECMPMISGLLIHMFNTGVASLPEVEEGNRELPQFLKHFRNGFVSEHSNVVLFLLKIMCNTKEIFLPYLQHMFATVAKALVRHLSLKHFDLNYVVRDFLLMIIESRYVPSASVDQETQVAQSLFETLLVRVPNRNVGFQKYNLEIIESLCTLWSGSSLTWPRNMNDLFETSDMGYHVLLIFLRVNLCDARNELVRQEFLKNRIIVMSLDSLRHDNKGSNVNVEVIEKSFEMLGMILRFNENPELEDELVTRILISLAAYGNIKADYSSRFACAVYAGWQSESENCTQILLKFVSSQISKTPSLGISNRCLELYLDRLIAKQIDPEKVISELDSYIGLNRIFSLRTLGCLGSALRILERLVSFIPESGVRKYLDHVATGYCSPELYLLEHRCLSYKCLADAYVRFPDSPSAGLWLAQLVRGFDDPGDEVQEILLNFWRNQFQFETCCERLLKLLTMYAPALKDNFARLICLVMLDLTNKSSDINRTMFPPLIEQCAFKEWNPTAAGNSMRRLQQLGSMVPLFVPSLMQATQRLEHQMLSSDSCSAAGMGNSFLGSLMIRATGELIFEPTLSAASQSGRSSTRIPDPSQNQLSKRFIPSLSTERTSATPPFENRNNYHSQLRKEKNTRQSSSKLYRKYRIGDFPDIEITHASFLLSLRQLMMRDWLICKDFAVSLVCSLTDRLKGTDKYSALLAGINSVFEKLMEEEERNNFVPAALEIAQHVGDVELDSKCVGRLCKSMKLDALGIVLLEESNTRSNSTDNRTELQDDPPAKRMRRDIPNDKWIELANLYKSIGYSDVVGSVMCNSDSISRNVKDGALAQLAGDWAAAKQSFEMAYENVLDVEQDYCLDSMFECMRQLAQWGDINKVIDKILVDDYNAVWNHSKKMLLLPWIFEAQLHKALDDYTSDKHPEVKNMEFVQKINDWISATDTFEIKSDYGQELSVILMCSGQKSEEASRFSLHANLNRIRDQWIRLSPIAENARFGILTKLRGIYDIDTYMKTIKANDIKEATESLMQHWNQHLPSVTEDLASWNMQISCRLAFAKLLHEKLRNDSEDNSLANEILVASAKQRIVISEMAINNRNNIVAKKQTVRCERLIQRLNTIEEITEANEFINLKHDFMLTAAKYKLLCAENESNARSKYNYYANSWKIANDLLQNENPSSTIRINTKNLLFDLTSSIRQAAGGNEELTARLSSDNFVSTNAETLEEETLSEKLIKHSFDILKSVYDLGSSKEMAESYTKFGKYCYSLIQNGHFNVSTSLVDEFISSILTAMSLGSLEAAHYFPCLLKYEYYENRANTNQIFISKSANVPTWLFLFWEAQIVTYLDKPLAHMLIPVMRRLVQDYPNGIVYDFRQMYITLPQEIKANPDIRSMYESLFTDSKLESFIEAMHYVCQPENYLRYHLLQLRDSRENLEDYVNSIIEKVYGKQTEKQGPIPGPLYNLAIGKYRTEVEKLANLDQDAIKLSVTLLSEKLSESVERRIAASKYQSLQLKDFSPYLAYFTNKDLDIEIPGQYCKREKPLLKYHIKLSKFDRSVSVMDSKYKPIRVSMIGNNAKTYDFLVKCGEDLRQDQRLQQIFNIANETFESDKNCNRRYLSVNTYHVVPLSISLGLIEWVNEARSLREFIEFSMNDKLILSVVVEKYAYWINKAARPSKNSYKEALIKYDRKTVISKMKEFIDHFDWDCLRKAFAMISPSLECFVSLRHNFITSYATMCAVHWLTGVGDRHLKNMLIEVKTGRCCGIDFGAAFGAGVDQAVPELVPFRLTPQILGLLKPFNEQALFGVTMTHVLRALRNERGPILACLNVFIHEPLNWSTNRNEKSHEGTESSEDIKWSAKKKIEIVKIKLSGIDSSTIMLKELSNMHGRDKSIEYFSRYADIINGTDQNHKSFRSTVLNKRLTPEEQVKCLLEHATDLNVLGRMYAGWCPFV